MRRLEVERIDEVPVQAGWVGAGDAASGPQIKPANPRRWPWGASPGVRCGARASCLARTAPGRPRDPARRPLRAVCEELAARSSAQMPETETRPWGRKSPPVERREASASSQDARRASGSWMRLSALRSPRFGEPTKKGKPGAQNTNRWAAELCARPMRVDCQLGLLRSSPRKRGPAMTSSRLWMPAFVGTSGETCRSIFREGE